MQIIELDNNDDIVSVCDRLTWASEQRVLLVLPPDGAVLHRPIDLVRLRRCADSLRIDVGLVVEPDEEVSHQARALGIPTFGSVAVAQGRSRAWRRNRRREQLGFLSHNGWRWPAPVRQNLSSNRTPGRRRRLWVYTVILLALMLVAGALITMALLIPAATVALRPVSRPLRISQTVAADPARSTAGLATGVISAHAITHTVSWTGEMAVPGVVRTADRERLRAQALQALQTDALNEITGRLSANSLLLDGSLRLVEIDEESYSSAAGTRADHLGLHLRVTVSAATVKSALVNGALYDGLLASLPAGFQLAPGTLRIDEIRLIGEDTTGRIAFTVTGRALAVAKMDLQPYLSAISGRPAAEAIAYLEAQLPLRDAPVVALRPAWWAERIGRLPFQITRIEVELVD
jgi:hypothetical protein